MISYKFFKEYFLHSSAADVDLGSKQLAAWRGTA